MEHRHAVDRLQLDLRAAHRHVAGEILGRRARCRSRLVSATSPLCADNEGRGSGNLFTGWMLLSYRKAAVASSTMKFAADRRQPLRIRGPSSGRREQAGGETLLVDLGAAKTLRARCR